jgi:hypothetical protein
MSSIEIQLVPGRIFWRLQVLSLWLGDKPGEEGRSVTPLVLQVYLRDHTGSLDNPDMDTQSELMDCHSDFLIGSTYLICSPNGNINITLPSYQ